MCFCKVTRYQSQWEQIKYFVHRESQYTLQTEELTRTTVTTPNWQERMTALILPAVHSCRSEPPRERILPTTLTDEQILMC